MTKNSKAVEQEKSAPVEEIAPDQVTDPGKQDMSLPEEEEQDSPEDKLISRALEVFASHDVNEIYFTSDGTAFIQPQFARLHAENLEDNRVLTVKRKEV
ncbi:MAG: hypothetical protein NTW16_05745 [Bacteroidetes bacterium]|nr:hypothetical protein [Bacteroidota bacterium]